MIRRHAVVWLVVAVIALPARAQSSRGDGSQTGDGSTPFTGLAQAPEAQMFVGAAQTAIPIQVPPGRKGITPNLTLRYSSSAGPSPYGFGWDLPLPRVQRATKNGARTCAADRNEFLLTLPSGTIACTLQASGRCVPHAEEAFAKIVATVAWDGSANRLTWTVWDKSGIRYTFGGPAASTNGGTSFTVAARSGDDAYQGASTSACGFGASWELTSLVDTRGNRLDAYWLLAQNVLYPASIKYGANAAVPHSFEVAFVWEPRAADGGGVSTDDLTTGTNGVAAVLSQRLARINVRYTGQVRAYTFTYAPDRSGRQTFLESVALHGSDDSVLLAADGTPAASTFLYHAKTPGFAATAQSLAKPAFAEFGNTFRWTDDGNNPNHATRRDVLDMNGDAFPDLVDTGGCATSNRWSVYLGSAAGFSGTPITWFVPNTNIMCSLRTSTDNATDSTNVTHWGTIDLTGDGIPDFVDARTSPWIVYPGVHNAAPDGWGFGAALSWGSPVYAPYVQRSRARTINNPGDDHNWNGMAVYQDLVDMTGDGRPDLVIAPGVGDSGGSSILSPLNTATWTVYPNTGSGFGGGYDFQGPFQSLTFTTSNGSNYNGMVYGTFDVNGDGLPDGVISQRARGANYSGAWRVCLNSGTAMDACADWVVPQVGQMWRWIRATDNSQPADIRRDFVDINGDGLPDLVDATGWSAGTPTWLAFLNRGNGFEQTATAWPAPMGRIRDVGSGGQRTSRDTFDVDGDGLVDFLDFTTTPALIFHAADGAWAASGSGVVEQENGLRPDLLVASENGIGSTTYLQYRPSSQWDNTGGDGVPDLPFVVWTVTEIRHDDGLCGDAGCINPGSVHELGMTYRYAAGRYDPIGRALRGFALVSGEELGDAATPHRGTLTRFHQTAAFAGKVATALTYDARGGPDTHPLGAAINVWECADPVSGAVVACPGEPLANLWVRLSSTQTAAYSSFSFIGPKQRKTTNESWHQCGSPARFYGNVQDVTDGALNGSPVLRTHTEYACSDSASSYVVDRPTHVLVTNSTATQNLEEKWFSYDAFWSVTSTESWLDQSSTAAPPSCAHTPAQGSGGCVNAITAYDAYGNVVASTDALGRTTTMAYDAATHSYPISIIQPPAVGYATGYEVRRQYDPGCGTLQTETIPFRGSVPSYQTVHQYDAFCRAIATWRPGESTAATPYRRYAYRLGAPGKPTATSSERREPSHGGTGTVLTTMLADALARPIEEKTESEVDGNVAFVATATQYDGQGRVSRQSIPFLWTCAAGGCFLDYTDPPAGTASATFAYDALGRPTRQTHADGKSRSSDYGVAWQTTTFDECAQPGETCPGNKTVEKRDALGRTVERWRYNQAGDQMLAATKLDYDLLGRPIATTQRDAAGWNGATTVTTTYDSLGRKIAVRDPDATPSVDWRFGYDLAGNLLYQNDPSPGQHLEFCYDALNRPTRKFALDGDTYTAKSCAAAETVSYTYNESALFGLGKLANVADEAGTFTVLEYDVLGRVLREERAIDFDGDVTSAQMRYRYDAGDHVDRLTYPDGEVVSYGFDGAGRISSIAGREAYLLNLTYDQFGRPRKITHRNGIEDERTYAASGYRLSEIKITRGSQAPTVLLDYGYAGYDAAGRLLALTDTTPNKGPGAILDNAATYTYDALGRLTRVTGPQLGDRQYAVNSLDNLTVKDGSALTYVAVKPHQPATFNGQSMAHDLNGNRTLANGSLHTYQYDAENRLTGIDGGQVELAYAFTGRRAIMKNADGSVRRYFSSLFEASSLGTVTKYYAAGDLLIAQRDEANPQFAAAELGAAVRVAARSLAEPAAIVLILRRDVQIGVALAALTASVLLAITPPRRRRRIVGIRLRPGHALGTALAIVVGTMPWPILLFPAAAEGQCGSPPIAVHYHLDQLGSTQLLTNPAGNVIEHVRYTPYGTPRRFSAAGATKDPDSRYRREFTGYETDFYSGLQYAGARFYDPQLGMFQSHDPARQFANPYTYTDWDPVNRSDPSGAWVALAALVGLGAIAAAIDAGIRTGSPLAAFKAFNASLTTSGVAPGSSYGLQVLLPEEFGRANASEYAYRQIPLGGTVYGAVRNFKQGNYASGVVGALALAYQVYGLYQNVNGQGGDGLSQSQQLEISAAEFDQQFETPVQRGITSAASYLGRIVAHDVAAAVVGITAKPAVLAQDLWMIGRSVAHFDAASIASSTLNTVIDAIIPTYGFYGGAGWGTRQFGELGSPAPLNRVDWANFNHDIMFQHLNWVRDVWSSATPGLPPGPFGLAYGAIGTVPFSIGGLFQ